MDETLKLVVTQKGLNVFQRIHAAFTADGSSSLMQHAFIATLIPIFFVLLLIVFKVVNKSFIQLIFPFIITNIILIIAMAISSNAIGRGYYMSGEMTVTDVENQYSDKIEPEYTGSTITGIKDGKKMTLETLPEESIYIKRAVLHEVDVQMKENQVKKGDIITVKTDDMYISKDSWKTMDKSSLLIYPKVHIVK